MAYQSLLDSLLNCFRIDTSSGNVSVYGSLQQGAIKSSLVAANSDGVLVAATGISDFLKVGIENLTATGTPSATTYLRGDNTWATITIPSGNFQPLDDDLTAIAGLADSSGLLRKVDATPSWVIDTAEYMTITSSDARYQVISGRKNSLVANNTSYYYSVTAVNNALADKMNITGGEFTGNLTIHSSDPSLIFNDNSSGGVFRFMITGGQFYLKYGTTSPVTLMTVNSTGGFTLESTITSTGFKTPTGTAAQFLKANGTVDSTLYQPLDADLTAIAALADSSGLLRKVDATPSWTIDTAEYMTITSSDARYQVLSGRKDSIVANNTSFYYSVTAVNNALATKMGVAGGTFTGDLTIQSSYPTIVLNDTSSGGVYRISSDGGAFTLRYGTTTPPLIVSISSAGAITANSFIKDGGTAAQFLKANGTVDSSVYITASALTGYLTTAVAATTYQPLNANLTAITGFGTSTGILKKINDTGWALDTSTYMTAAAVEAYGYQVISNLSTNLTASASKYPSVNAVNTGLAGRLSTGGGTLSGGLTLTYSVPTISLNDNSAGVIWNIINDGSTFKLNNGATNKFYIFSNGNSEFINNLTAASFIKSGGTSAQFLMGDGSVSTNPGWITGITSSNVITALGFTPYNNTNPAGYITSSYITNANIVSALGYTPYNATNPNGYVTLTEANGLYLKLTGGTLTGSLTATAFYESSDKNLKTLIATDYQAKGIESIVSRLYIKNGKEELGYFAQDVESILPSAVSVGTDGYLSLSYREVHTAKIAYLEREVAELKAQLARL